MNEKQALLQAARSALRELEAVFEAVDEAELETMLDRLQAARRVFLTGAGREGIATRGFAMRLTHLGKQAHWLMDDTTPAMGPGDLFLCVNGSGCIASIDGTLERARATGASIQIVTGSPCSLRGAQNDGVFFLPAAVYKGRDKRVVPSGQPMGNLFEQALFLFFDLCAVRLAERMGLSYAQMEARHRNIE